jgi:hypothetical protein
MPRHVVVDGSNLATEGRALPSLKQLNEAVLSYMAENPDALITVVVDASFGHRIDAKEVAEFDAAVSNNEIVAPPAGAIGRGDAFVLSIANKVNATILSNDSYQEFHGTYTWLFDEGRLVGGKPVPHIGWVFVNRLPVRGPTSRKSVSEAKRGGRAPKVKTVSAEASQPMPVPASPPPGAVLPKPSRGRGDDSKAAAAAAKPGHPAKSADTGTATNPPKAEPTPKTTGTNDLLAFLNFVEHHQPGSSVNAIVENYSSHGAYVRIGEVKGYVPLSLMADPAPRSAREFMKVGESVTLVVESFAPARRSIDLAIPTMAAIKSPPPEPVAEAKPKRASRKAVNKPPAAIDEPPAPNVDAAPAPKQRVARKRADAVAKPAVVRKASTKKAQAETTHADEAQPETVRPDPPADAAPSTTPAKKRSSKKAVAMAAPVVEPAPPAKLSRRRSKAS